MKTYRNIVLIGLFFYLPLHANTVEPTIPELIQDVQNAPDKQKRVLMNQLKSRLKNMNSKSRKEVMIKLKKSFAKKGVQHRKHQKEKSSISHSCNHQPKFRHLRQGHQGEGEHKYQGDGHR